MPFPAFSAGKSRLIYTNENGLFRDLVSPPLVLSVRHKFLRTVSHTFVDRYHAAMLSSDFLAKGI